MSPVAVGLVCLSDVNLFSVSHIVFVTLSYVDLSIVALVSQYDLDLTDLD